MATTFGALAEKLLTLRKQVPFGTTPRPCGSNLERGRCLALLEGFCFSVPGPFMLAGSGWTAAGELSAQVKRNPPIRVEERA